MQGTEGEDQETRREIEELHEEVEAVFDELLRLANELPGNRRTKEGTEDGGRIVRIDARRWRRRGRRRRY